MIELAASGTTPPAKGALAPVSAAQADDFLLTLAGFLDDAAATSDAEPALAIAPDKRQAAAAGGKDLPADGPDEDDDVQLIWLPGGLVWPPPVPAARSIALPVSNEPTPPVIDGPSIPPCSSAKAGVQPGETIDKSATLRDQVPAFAGEPLESAPVRDGVVGPVTRSSDTLGPPGLPIRLDASSARALRQDQPQPPLPQPASQAFTTAIVAALHAQRDEREPADARVPLAIATLEATHRPIVQATIETRQGARDLRQDSGLQGMIDHIEVLRDHADANDTRIRLVPDALGAVDVSVRKEGERVHVHFSAENLASARLIQDAQPRLTELAEARGVRLGHTSVDAGAGGSRQQPPPSRPILPHAPAHAHAHAPAPASPGVGPDALADHRIA